MVITGNGKGKTTSAFGQALRAVGQGYRVIIIQFMKGHVYGEILALKKYLPQIKLFQFGTDNCVKKNNLTAIDIDLAGQGFEKALEAVKGQEFDMVILDEINVAVDYRLIPEEKVLDLIINKNPELDLILTGRYATERIKAYADMVSEVLEIKHHFNNGIKSRAGIEF